jgi:hypothetical protein
MALIDQTYFVYDISLPAGIYSDISGWIDRLEPSIIRNLLGAELGQLVVGYDQSTSDQRIKDIVEGATFEHDEKTLTWDGLKNNNKKSLLAYRIYVEYLRYNITTTTATGERKAKNENSSSADQSFKIWRAQQKFNDEVATLLLFIDANIEVYPEFVKPETIPGGNLNAFDL